MQGIKRARAFNWMAVASGAHAVTAVEIPPGVGAYTQHVVQSLDVLHAAPAQPAAQRFETTLTVLWDALLPGSPPAQHA